MSRRLRLFSNRCSFAAAAGLSLLAILDAGSARAAQTMTDYVTNGAWNYGQDAVQDASQRIIDHAFKGTRVPFAGDALVLVADSAKAAGALDSDLLEFQKRLAEMTAGFIAGGILAAKMTAAGTPAGWAVLGTAAAAYTAKECTYWAASKYYDSEKEGLIDAFMQDIAGQSLVRQIKEIDDYMAEANKNGMHDIVEGLAAKRAAVMKSYTESVAAMAKLAEARVQTTVVLRALDRAYDELHDKHGENARAELRARADIHNFRIELERLAGLRKPDKTRIAETTRKMAELGKKAEQHAAAAKTFSAMKQVILARRGDIASQIDNKMVEIQSLLNKTYGDRHPLAGKPSCSASSRGSRDTTLVRPVQIPPGWQNYSATIAAGFKAKGVGQPCDAAPAPNVGASGHGGTIRVTIEGNPPVPCEWSLYNSGISAELLYEPDLGTKLGPPERLAAGSLGCGPDEPLATKTEFDAEMPGAGRLTLRVGAPSGAGPLNGACFGQGGTVKAEMIRPDLNVTYKPGGTVMKPGDTLVTGPNGETVMTLPPGANVKLFPHSGVGLRKTPAGVEFLEFQKGRVRVNGKGGPSPNVTVDDYSFAPKGTDFELEKREQGGVLTVFDGSVTVVKPDGGAVEVEAGQQFAWPENAVTAADTAKLAEPMTFDELAADQLIAEDGATPAGDYPLTLVDGQPANGWLWQDPRSDATIAAAADAIRITVPTENELWQGNNRAPRLLHRVSGDFELEGELQVSPGPVNFAISEFLLYAPGQFFGYLAGQQPLDGPGADYLILGGGWLNAYNQSRLAALAVDRPSVDDFPMAPDHPVKLRLVRTGDLWRTYTSIDGKTWSLTSRQSLAAPHTVYAGLLFKRIDHDGKGAGITELRNVVLRASPDVPLADPAWDFDVADGSIAAAGEGFRLVHSGKGRGETSLDGGRLVRGDFDWVMRYRLDQAQALAAGQQRGVRLVARADDRTEFYVGLHDQPDGRDLRWHSDARRNGNWTAYRWQVTDAASGLLRLVRRGALVTGYIWQDGVWREIQRIEAASEAPVFIGAHMHGVGAEALAEVEFLRRSATPMAEDSPDAIGPPLLGPADWPAGVEIGDGRVGRRFLAPYPLGNLFVGRDGAVYLMTSTNYQTPERQRRTALVRVDAAGLSRAVFETALFSGLNGKAGFVGDDGMRISVDSWGEGGNPHSGIYAPGPAGEAVLIGDTNRYSGIGDMIELPGGDMLIADFEADNIFRIAPDGTERERLLADRGDANGLRALAHDRRSGTIYAVNGDGPSPFGGPNRIYIVTDGVLHALATADEGATWADIAVSPGGAFKAGLYATIPETGRVVRIGDDGRQETVVSGLTKPGTLDFDPVTGDLWLIADGREVMMIGAVAAATDGDDSATETEANGEDGGALPPEAEEGELAHVAELDPAGDGYLSLRAGPGGKFREKRRLPPGTELRILDRDGKWLYVRLADGFEGWVFGDYVTTGAPGGGAGTSGDESGVDNYELDDS